MRKNREGGKNAMPIHPQLPCTGAARPYRGTDPDARYVGLDQMGKALRRPVDLISPRIATESQQGEYTDQRAHWQACGVLVSWRNAENSGTSMTATKVRERVILHDSGDTEIWIL